MADIVANVKKAFFDHQKVIRLMNWKIAKGLKRLGGLIRITAKRSMKSRTGPSAPGTPPHKHRRKQLDRLLFYSYDANRKMVVVGPAILQGYGHKSVPKLMEQGGSRVDYVRKSGRPIRRDYPKRAFMMPTLLEHQSKAAQFMAGI